MAIPDVQFGLDLIVQEIERVRSELPGLDADDSSVLIYGAKADMAACCALSHATRSKEICGRLFEDRGDLLQVLWPSSPIPSGILRHDLQGPSALKRRCGELGMAGAFILLEMQRIERIEHPTADVSGSLAHIEDLAYQVASTLSVYQRALREGGLSPQLGNSAACYAMRPSLRSTYLYSAEDGEMGTCLEYLWPGTGWPPDLARGNGAMEDSLDRLYDLAMAGAMVVLDLLRVGTEVVMTRRAFGV